MLFWWCDGVHVCLQRTVDRFLKYYEAFESRPVFGSVEEMLKWTGLYSLTTRSLEEELLEAGLSPLLIQELVTVRNCHSFYLWLLIWIINVLFSYGLNAPFLLVKVIIEWGMNCLMFINALNRERKFDISLGRMLLDNSMFCLFLSFLPCETRM